jgi:hypothetical protein
MTSRLQEAAARLSAAAAKSRAAVMQPTPCTPLGAFGFGAAEPLDMGSMLQGSGGSFVVPGSAGNTGWFSHRPKRRFSADGSIGSAIEVKGNGRGSFTFNTPHGERAYIPVFNTAAVVTPGTDLSLSESVSVQREYVPIFGGAAVAI